MINTVLTLHELQTPPLYKNVFVNQCLYNIFHSLKIIITLSPSRSTSDVSIFGYTNIILHSERSSEVWQFSPETPCVFAAGNLWLHVLLSGMCLDNGNDFLKRGLKLNSVHLP